MSATAGANKLFFPRSEVPLVQVLPEKSFTDSSSYNDSVKASNVRFPSSSGMPKEPWCSDTQNDTDKYFKQFVTVDLGCPQTVHKVEGKDPNAQFYAVEYSNNKTGWTDLTSEHKAFDKNWNVSVTSEAMFHPLPHPQAPSVGLPCPRFFTFKESRKNTFLENTHFPGVIMLYSV